MITQHEADELVKRFLTELDVCTSEQERIAKVWELIHGVIVGARAHKPQPEEAQYSW